MRKSSQVAAAECLWDCLHPVFREEQIEELSSELKINRKLRISTNFYNINFPGSVLLVWQSNWGDWLYWGSCHQQDTKETTYQLYFEWILKGFWNNFCDKMFVKVVITSEPGSSKFLERRIIINDGEECKVGRSGKSERSSCSNAIFDSKVNAMQDWKVSIKNKNISFLTVQNYNLGHFQYWKFLISYFQITITTTLLSDISILQQLKHLPLNLCEQGNSIKKSNKEWINSDALTLAGALQEPFFDNLWWWQDLDNRLWKQ